MAAEKTRGVAARPDNVGALLGGLALDAVMLDRWDSEAVSLTDLAATPGDDEPLERCCARLYRWLTRDPAALDAASVATMSAAHEAALMRASRILRERAALALTATEADCIYEAAHRCTGIEIEAPQKIGVDYERAVRMVIAAGESSAAEDDGRLAEDAPTSTTTGNSREAARHRVFAGLCAETTGAIAACIRALRAPTAAMPASLMDAQRELGIMEAHAKAILLLLRVTTEAWALKLPVDTAPLMNMADREPDTDRARSALTTVKMLLQASMLRGVASEIAVNDDAQSTSRAPARATVSPKRAQLTTQERRVLLSCAEAGVVLSRNRLASITRLGKRTVDAALKGLRELGLTESASCGLTREGLLRAKTERPKPLGQ